MAPEKQLTPFVFSETSGEIRTINIDGDPWFVAVDVCRELGISDASQAVRDRLDPDEYQQVVPNQCSTDIDVTKPPQRPVNIVSESGLYSLILWSTKPEAKRFKRWITTDVLPALRRTGSYSVRPKTRVELARDLLAAEEALEASEAARLAAEAAAKELEGPADAWNTLASSQGDLSVGDVAKALSRDHGIVIGQNNLFRKLGELGWIYRGRGDGGWRAKQAAVDLGWLAQKVQSHRHPADANIIIDTPQVRITARGMQRLLAVLRPAGQEVALLG